MFRLPFLFPSSQIMPDRRLLCRSRICFISFICFMPVYSLCRTKFPVQTNSFYACRRFRKIPEAPASFSDSACLSFFLAAGAAGSRSKPPFPSADAFPFFTGLRGQNLSSEKLSEKTVYSRILVVIKSTPISISFSAASGLSTVQQLTFSPAPCRRAIYSGVRHSQYRSAPK